MQALPLFPNTRKALGTADFKAVIKQEIESLSCHDLPLQQGLTHGSYALDNGIEAMILQIQAMPFFYTVK